MGLRSLIIRIHVKKVLILYILSIIIVSLQGCATLSNGRGWGQDATLMPGWDRIKKSAVNAVLSPETWGPVAGAIALQVDNMDKRISDWASDNTPIFGSRENANNWSNYLETTSGAIYFTTALATPSGDDASDWLKAKAKGLAIGLTSIELTSASTALIKGLSGRERPDGSDKKSFPSGHTSRASAFTTLARRNLEYISLSPGSRIFTDIGIIGIAAGTGWARIEAKKHYPSDVLMGYSLGHFFSSFINDAFLGLDNRNTPQVIIEPSRKGMWVGLGWTY